MLSTNKLKELDELILMDDKHEVIVDVGGNKTSSLVLDEIKKVGSFGNVKWIIPLGDGVYRDWETDRKSTRLNSSHITRSRMPSSA